MLMSTLACNVEVISIAASAQAFKMSRANSCTSGIVVGIKIFMLVKDL